MVKSFSLFLPLNILVTVKLTISCKNEILVYSKKIGEEKNSFLLPLYIKFGFKL
jgi:hypothetical protein